MDLYFILSVEITRFLLISLVLLLCYKLLRKDLPQLLAKLKKSSFKRLFRVTSIILTIFVVYFLCLNVLPFNFIAHNEIETKYDYSFYQVSLNGFTIRLPTQGSCLTGLHIIFSNLYSLFKIDTFSKTIAFNKIALSILFVISFFLIRKILNSYLPKGKSSEYFSLLLTLLYFSLPQIAFYFWTQELLVMSAYFFFLLAFSFLVDYFRSRSVLDLTLCILASYISFQARQELAIYVSLLFIIHLANSFDLSRFRLEHLAIKEKYCLLAHFLSTLLLGVLSYAYLNENFGAGSIHISKLVENLSAFYRLFLGPFSPILLLAILILILISALRANDRAKLVLFPVIALFLLLLPIIVSNRFQVDLYVYYSLLFFVLSIAIIIAGAQNASNKLWQGIAAAALVFLIVFCNLYLITSKTNLVVVNSPYDLYNRGLTLEQANQTLAEYSLMAHDNLAIFDVYSGQTYLAYLLKDTNNTLYNLFDLPALYNPENNITQVIVLSRPGCTHSEVQDFVNTYYANIYPQDRLDKEPAYDQLISFINNSSFEEYARISDQTFCRILPNPSN